MSARLSTRFEVIRDCPLLHLSGILDGTTSPRFREDASQLVATGYKQLVLDFSEVTMMDSSGIGALIHLFHSIQEQGGQFLWVAACPPGIRSLLEVTQIDRQIRCFDTVSMALEAFRVARYKS
jgi:anti-sigma B factor antagonist